MDLVVVEHQPDAPAGLLGEWAATRGMSSALVRVHAGDPWPAVGATRRVAVLGSDRSVHADPPRWLAGELAWLRGLTASAIPVLGLCFGAQALALALDGVVRRAQQPEIGWIDVTGELAGTWFAWHFDAFALPPGARDAGRSRGALQAFAAGPHLGLQFHPEVTPRILADWVATGRGDLDAERLDGAVLRARAVAEARASRSAAYALFDGWVARSVDRAA